METNETSEQPMNLDMESAAVEAILFLESEPIDTITISKISGLAKDIVETVLPMIQERFNANDHGIELMQISGGWTFTPKRVLWESLKDRYGKKNEGKLSKAALETLSIIAYSQPVTRAEIEAIRGVQVDNMVRLLLDRNLIRETGKKDVPGKPVQYGTTKEFLKFFRLNSIAELPKLNEEDRERFEIDEQPEATDGE